MTQTLIFAASLILASWLSYMAGKSAGYDEFFRDFKRIEAESLERVKKRCMEMLEKIKRKRGRMKKLKALARLLTAKYWAVVTTNDDTLVDYRISYRVDGRRYQFGGACLKEEQERMLARCAATWLELVRLELRIRAMRETES